MSARLVEEASVTLPLLGPSLEAKEIAADATLSAPLFCALDTFIAVITALKTGQRQSDER